MRYVKALPQHKTHYRAKSMMSHLKSSINLRLEVFKMTFEEFENTDPFFFSYKAIYWFAIHCLKPKLLAWITTDRRLNLRGLKFNSQQLVAKTKEFLDRVATKRAISICELRLYLLTDTSYVQKPLITLLVLYAAFFLIIKLLSQFAFNSLLSI